MRCMQAEHKRALSKTAMPLFNDDLMVVGKGVGPYCDLSACMQSLQQQILCILLNTTECLGLRLKLLPQLNAHLLFL